MNKQENDKKKHGFIGKSDLLQDKFEYKIYDITDNHKVKIQVEKRAPNFNNSSVKLLAEKLIFE